MDIESTDSIYECYIAAIIRCVDNDYDDEDDMDRI